MLDRSIPVTEQVGCPGAEVVLQAAPLCLSQRGTLVSARHEGLLLLLPRSPEHHFSFSRQ